MLNSSYGSNPEISNLTTFSETRQPDFGAKSIYFAISKTKKKVSDGLQWLSEDILGYPMVVF